ncbi:MAG: D-glycerate dehydrogenase [Spirochaetaceae bacterium]|nr:D-glycerate dehydrogenase [Spirochaetaceae bacterium]
MADNVLVMAEVEPYRVIVPMIAERCRVVRWRPDDDAWHAELPRIDGIYTYAHVTVSAGLMDATPRLKVISNFGVGCDHIDLAAAEERGIPVGNTPHVLDGATADITFALLLAGARNIVKGDHFARGPDFLEYDPSFMLGQEVHHQTLGIIGLGNIGYQVARRAQGFDMTVLYHNRTRNRKAEADLGARYVALDELLARSDFVALNMPLTDQTRGMIGARELGLMKESAVLVNAARGAVIDHDALLDTMRAGKLHCAAVDVTEPEPLPRDHPLLELDNVIVIPHLGSATEQTRQAMSDLSVRNLLAGLEGRKLPNRIV